jgi:hypothetical protein
VKAYKVGDTVQEVRRAETLADWSGSTELLKVGDTYYACSCDDEFLVTLRLTSYGYHARWEAVAIAPYRPPARPAPWWRRLFNCKSGLPQAKVIP